MNVMNNSYESDLQAFGENGRCSCVSYSLPVPSESDEKY